eukprot:15453793-Alexandrium_andersonii.AAC.1
MCIRDSPWPVWTEKASRGPLHLHRLGVSSVGSALVRAWVGPGRCGGLCGAELLMLWVRESSCRGSAGGGAERQGRMGFSVKGSIICCGSCRGWCWTVLRRIDRGSSDVLGFVIAAEG